MANIIGKQEKNELKCLLQNSVRTYAIGTNYGRTKVYRLLVDQFGSVVEDVVGERTVGNWLSQHRSNERREFKREEWKPWVTHLTHEPRASFLLALQSCSMALLRGQSTNRLQVHEAEWAGRLEWDLSGISDPVTQWALIREYAHREVSGYELKEEYFTGDLDELLLHKPWEKEHASRYELAIRERVIQPAIFLTLSLDPGEKDTKKWWLAVRVHRNLKLPYDFLVDRSSDGYQPGTLELDHSLLNMDWRDLLRNYLLYLRDTEELTDDAGSR